MPWDTCTEIHTKLSDSVAHAKDRATRKYSAQSMRFKAALSQQVLKDPAGHLGVVRRDPNPTKSGMAVRQIVLYEAVDLMAVLPQHRL